MSGEGETRTPTPFRAHDPKSCSSTNSDTSPKTPIANYGTTPPTPSAMHPRIVAGPAERGIAPILATHLSNLRRKHA